MIAPAKKEEIYDADMPRDRICAFLAASDAVSRKTNRIIQHQKTRDRLTAVSILYYEDGIRYTIRGGMWIKSTEYALVPAMIHLRQVHKMRPLEFALRSPSLIDKLKKDGELDNQRRNGGLTGSGDVPYMYDDLCILQNDRNATRILLAQSSFHGRDGDISTSQQVARDYAKELASKFDRADTLHEVLSIQEPEWQAPHSRVVSFI